MSGLPESHPRKASLEIRDKIVDGVEVGITSIHGLIAHGRGEAFDYLLGEETKDFATVAIGAARRLMMAADSPVISVNGNAAALVPDELIQLSRVSGAPIEVNIFHESKCREQCIRRHLINHGARDVLLPTSGCVINGLSSNRRRVHPTGIYRADVVFVPLEDGDRCEALRKLGKDIITIDLNPLSRTARTASITIVDHVIRAMSVLLKGWDDTTRKSNESAREILNEYSQAQVLREAEKCIRRCQPLKANAEAGSSQKLRGDTDYPSCLAPEGKQRLHANVASSHFGKR